MIMNNSTLNGSTSNGTANTAEDAILSDGISAGVGIAAKLTVSVVLSAALFTSSTVYANQWE